METTSWWQKAEKWSWQDVSGIKAGEGAQETFAMINVSYLDYSGGFTVVYTCQNVSNLYFKYLQLIVYVKPQ